MRHAVVFKLLELADTVHAHQTHAPAKATRMGT
jgi:hypothetical protein